MPDVKNKNPEWNGKVQTDEGTDSKDVGTIAFWKNEPKDGGSDKQPLYRGLITKKDGKKLRVALWKFVPKKKESEDDDL